MKTIPFKQASYLMLGLLGLAIFGFWNSYFSKLFDPSVDFNGYFHFHAIMASLWLFILIIQPTLIKSGKWQLHRRVGYFAHSLMALFFISAILLTHSQQNLEKAPHYIGVFIPFKDLLVLTVAYSIAMKYRKVAAIHARGMIATGIVFIEPALIRAIGNLFPSLANRYLWTIAIIYFIILALIKLGRKYKPGQWVFPLILFLYIIIHSLIIFRIPMPIFDRGAAWFLSLPLT